MAKVNLNSSLYWLPRIEAAGLPSPATVIIRYNHAKAVAVLEGAASYQARRVVTGIRQAIDTITGLPAFIRTDLASAKHNGPNDYLLKGTSREEILTVFWRTVEATEMKLWLSPFQPRAVLVRQFLHLNTSFRAFGGHPIAREWRYFSQDALLVCRHFYWPEEAIKFWENLPPPQGWRKQLKALAQPPPPALDKLAARAAQALSPGAWSIDFAQDRQGKWWLIDCALAADSWHPDHQEGG